MSFTHILTTSIIMTTFTGYLKAKSIIMQNFHVFMGMHPDEIVRDLQQHRLFDESDVQEVHRQGTRRAKMEVLLSMLYVKGPATCRMFLNILESREYGEDINKMRRVPGIYSMLL